MNRSPGAFLVRFAILALSLFLIARSFERELVLATARALAVTLELCGWEVDQTGPRLRDARRTFLVVTECTALLPLALLLGGIGASPVAWRARAVGVALGALGLFLVNQVRLTTLWIVRGRAPESFDLVHLYLWQPAMVGLVLVAWLAWWKHSAQPERSASINGR